MRLFEEQSICRRAASLRSFILNSAMTLSAITCIFPAIPLYADPGDFSVFTNKNHYSAVLEQQGRVQTDADWNEETAGAIRQGQVFGIFSFMFDPADVQPVVGSGIVSGLAVGADGVHLPSDDISPSEVRQIWSKCGVGAPARERPVITWSCHTRENVLRAESEGADAAIFAPVFEKIGSAAAGLAALREACRAKIPVLALGSITLQNAGSCLDAGAAGIAAIRLFQENRIEDVVRALRSGNIQNALA